MSSPVNYSEKYSRDGFSYPIEDKNPFWNNSMWWVDEVEKGMVEQLNGLEVEAGLARAYLDDILLLDGTERMISIIRKRLIVETMLENWGYVPARYLPSEEETSLEEVTVKQFYASTGNSPGMLKAMGAIVVLEEIETAREERTGMAF